MGRAAAGACSSGGTEGLEELSRPCCPTPRSQERFPHLGQPRQVSQWVTLGGTGESLASRVLTVAEMSVFLSSP